MKTFVNELSHYEFTGEVRIEESEDKKETPKMAIDEDTGIVDEKTEEKIDVSKPLVSCEISDEEERETVVV